MDTSLQKIFSEKWLKYFGDTELPVCMWFGDESHTSTTEEPNLKHSCLIGQISKVRKGHDLCVKKSTLGCIGAKYYLGYTNQLKPEFEYFLSSGNERIHGERYVKHPHEVLSWLDNQPSIPIHNRDVYFKRWDKLTAEDQPELIIFFANPDTLSGLYTLFNYVNFRERSIEAPFGAGCFSIITMPYLNPDKAFIGMFDPTARKCVPPDMLTFSFHFKHMEAIVEAMDESFLSTPAWATIRKRLECKSSTSD